MKRTNNSTPTTRKNSNVQKEEPKENKEVDFTYKPEEEPKITKFRQTHLITVQGSITNFKPIECFSEKVFPKDLLTVTKSFKQPTPIQSQCWPILLSQHNVVGIAQTGSGKTLAFGLPGLLHIQKQNSEFISPKMLVLAPTRELAIQIEEVLTKTGKPVGIKVACLYGGVAKGSQEQLLRDGVQVIVATPGRLIDFLESKVCDLSGVFFLVLDEADRMLDMGFEPDIKKILAYVPKERQTAMFSATWPPEIQKLAKQYIKSPIHVTIGTSEGKLVANSNVTQIVEVVTESDNRDTKLIQLLQKYHQSRKNKILIFVLYKKEAARLEKWLNQKGWNNIAIHSDKNQTNRIEALNAFKSGKTPLLIATDVASRGLDIPLVEYVINYSFPLTIEDYVHRIGRTGRAGNKGTAHTFFQQLADKQHAGGLVNVLKETNQEIPPALLQFDLSVKKKEPKVGKIELDKTANSHITFDSDDDN